MRYIKINGCGAIRSDAIVAVKMVTYDGKPKVSVSYSFANGLLDYMVADCGTLAERDELARMIIDAIVSENNICSTPKMFTMDKCLTPTRFDLANKCHWKKDEDGVYDTSCHNRFEFINGGIKDNGFVFCPYCGLSIKG